MQQQSIYHIPKMDCPSEEQLIRLKLGDLPDVQFLEFDIPARKLFVYHFTDPNIISSKLIELNLGAVLASTAEYTDAVGSNDIVAQRKLLWRVLAINLFFFVLEGLYGFFSGSMGLIADSLDMLADSFVYGLAIVAVSGGLLLKQHIAKTAGILQLLLACLGFAEVIRRSLSSVESPAYLQMIVISFLALIGNAWCLVLLQKSKSKEAHMKASMIFTSNDVIVNIGVIVAAFGVWFSNSPWPDLVVGTIVFILVAKGAFAILKLATANK